MDAVGRNLFTGIVPVAVVRKEPGKLAEFAYLTEEQPETDGFFRVEDQKDGKVKIWEKGECLGLDQYIKQTDKKLRNAARVIVAQQKLLEEQAKLLYAPKPEIGKNLDIKESILIVHKLSNESQASCEKPEYEIGKRLNLEAA